MNANDMNSGAAFFAWPNTETAGPAVSVVAPMHNEAGGAASLVHEIATVFSGENYEIVIVDDASSDETFARLDRVKAETPQLRILRHQQNAGQSRALRTAVLAARAPIIVMLDGDGQNDPADAPALMEALRSNGEKLAMVAGERINRKDSAAKKWASGAANGLRKRVLRDGSDDTGCGLKVFYREAFLRLPYFDHMHRYLPALMAREGFRVEYRPVSHRSRAHGRSKYTNLGRFLVAFRDLTGVLWLRGRARNPGKIEES